MRILLCRPKPRPQKILNVQCRRLGTTSTTWSGSQTWGSAQKDDPKRNLVPRLRRDREKRPNCMPISTLILSRRSWERSSAPRTTKWRTSSLLIQMASRQQSTAATQQSRCWLPSSIDLQALSRETTSSLMATTSPEWLGPRVKPRLRSRSRYVTWKIGSRGMRGLILRKAL